MRLIYPSVLILFELTLPAQADDVRDFNADTPGKSYTPYTVSQGYFQLESDSVHITQMGSMQTIETLDPVLKYGLTDDFEIELQTGGFLHMATTTNGGTVAQNGYGDTVPGVKLNVFGNDWQVFSAAVKGGIKIPTASPGFGNGAVEYYFIVPTQIGVSDTISLQIQEEIDLLKNQNDRGKHFSFTEDISLTKTLGKVSVSSELYAQSGTDARSKALYTADFGVGYAVGPAVVVSFGVYFGLNKYAANVEGYTGIGFRF